MGGAYGTRWDSRHIRRNRCRIVGRTRTASKGPQRGRKNSNRFELACARRERERETSLRASFRDGPTRRFRNVMGARSSRYQPLPRQLRSIRSSNSPLGVAWVGLNGGPEFKHNESFSFSKLQRRIRPRPTATGMPS